MSESTPVLFPEKGSLAVPKGRKDAPIMVIERITDGKAHCVWFVDREVRRDSFPVACLVAPI